MSCQNLSYNIETAPLQNIDSNIKINAFSNKENIIIATKDGRVINFKKGESVILHKDNIYEINKSPSRLALVMKELALPQIKKTKNVKERLLFIMGQLRCSVIKIVI
jgi:hypothetical protein